MKDFSFIKYGKGDPSKPGFHLGIVKKCLPFTVNYYSKSLSLHDKFLRGYRLRKLSNLSDVFC